MSMLGDAIGRGKRETSAARPPAPTPPAVPVGLHAPGADAERSELRHRRDALAQQVTELHWDLGGLAYEMAIRDHFRLDVLVRRAAVLQERDAELAEIERLLRLEESASAGACPACGAPHSRGAMFCWQCGTTLMQRAPSEVLSSSQVEHDEPTAAIDALLAPDGARRDGATGSQTASLAEE
jgi:hypothetical protein